MKYEDCNKSVREAIDRIASKSGKTRAEVVAAFDRAASGHAVNADSIFLEG